MDVDLLGCMQNVPDRFGCDHSGDRLQSGRRVRCRLNHHGLRHGPLDRHGLLSRPVREPDFSAKRFQLCRSFDSRHKHEGRADTQDMEERGDRPGIEVRVPLPSRRLVELTGRPAIHV